MDCTVIVVCAFVRTRYVDIVVFAEGNCLWPVHKLIMDVMLYYTSVINVQTCTSWSILTFSNKSSYSYYCGKNEILRFCVNLGGGSDVRLEIMIIESSVSHVICKFSCPFPSVVGLLRWPASFFCSNLPIEWILLLSRHRRSSYQWHRVIGNFY